MAATLTFLNQPFVTPFEKQTTVQNYLIGQTAFSTALGCFISRLLLPQAALVGLTLVLATEGSRYATNKITKKLTEKVPALRNYQAAVKTALVASSFFMTKIAINFIFPKSLGLLAASSLMTATYLAAEPISRRVYEACTTNRTIKECFLDVPKKNSDGFPIFDMDQDNLVGDLRKQYPIAMQKITDLWNRFFGSSGHRLGGNGT
ncbi:MAG: hypothetical protein C5B45_00140 [Chlamydiae bacterium]|nr:MAG: hypothetical protein C5B45_00140 [Chlamydiota bacterium]